jgi:hypothetical protein
MYTVMVGLLADAVFRSCISRYFDAKCVTTDPEPPPLVVYPHFLAVLSGFLLAGDGLSYLMLFSMRFQPRFLAVLLPYALACGVRVVGWLCDDGSLESSPPTIPTRV